MMFAEEADVILRMEDHPNIYFVGDVHGDLLPVIEILSHAGLIEGERLDVLTQCFLNDASEKMEMVDMTEEETIIDDIWWTGKTDAVVFLGDVLDNRRHANSDRFGVCGTAKTQQLLMYLLQTVKEKARVAGGDLVWVLGNHCIANVSTVRHLNLSMFAPQYFILAQRLQTLVDEEDPYLPSDYWRNIVLGFMKRMRAVVFLLIVHDNMPIACGLHGLLCESFCAHAGLVESTTLSQSVENALRIHDCVMRDLVYGSGPSIKMEEYPTWCRSVQSVDTPVKYIGVKVVFKGHDVSSKSWRRGKRVTTFYMDTGMGRSFKRSVEDSHAEEATTEEYVHGATRAHIPSKGVRRLKYARLEQLGSDYKVTVSEQDAHFHMSA